MDREVRDEVAPPVQDEVLAENLHVDQLVARSRVDRNPPGDRTDVFFVHAIEPKILIFMVRPHKESTRHMTQSVPVTRHSRYKRPWWLSLVCVNQE